jgi:hypothetical protein
MHSAEVRDGCLGIATISLTPRHAVRELIAAIEEQEPFQDVRMHIPATSAPVSMHSLAVKLALLGSGKGWCGSLEVAFCLR